MIIRSVYSHRSLHSSQQVSKHIDRSEENCPKSPEQGSEQRSGWINRLKQNCSKSSDLGSQQRSELYLCN